MESNEQVKRPAEEPLISSDTKRVKPNPELENTLTDFSKYVESAANTITAAVKPMFTPEYVDLRPNVGPAITGQFASVGNVVDTELLYLQNKLAVPTLDKDAVETYNRRIAELQAYRKELLDLSVKLSAVESDPQMAQFYKTQASDLLYRIDKNSEFSKLAVDAAERLNILQGIYAPSEAASYGPLSIMSTALFGMPDLNNDGTIDDKDLKTGKDAGTFDRNLAIRDADGKLLLYANKYDFNKLDRIGRFAYSDFKDFALQIAREGLDVGNRLPAGTWFSFRREGIPNYADFDKWPEDFKQKYYNFVEERAKTGTGYQKLQAYAELVQKKPYSEWTQEERNDFIKFQDAYVITDNNYGTYLVTRDNKQWNKDDAAAYNKQLAAGGNRYFVDHNAEYLIKVIKPIVIGANVVAGVATLGAAAAGLVASTIGTTIGTLGAASSLSVGSNLAGSALALGGFAGAGSAAAAAASTSITGSVINFGKNVVATGGENIVALGKSFIGNLVPQASNLATQTAVREISKAAGADEQTLAVLDAVADLSGSIVGTVTGGLQSAFSSGTLTKAMAMDTLKSALAQGLSGTQLVGFVTNSAENLVKTYAPDSVKELPRISNIITSALNGEDLVPLITRTIQDLSTTTLVLGDGKSSAAEFTNALNRFINGINVAGVLIGSEKANTIEGIAIALGNDYLLNQLPKERGRVFKSPVEEDIFMNASKQAYSENPAAEIGPYKLTFNSETIKAYVDPETRRVMVGVRGTADSRDRKAWIPTAVGALSKTDRYAFDKAQIAAIMQRFPPEQYNYFVSGHSLGGAIATELRREFPFIQKAIIYNSATAPKDIGERDAEDVKRIFYSSDVLYNLQGGKLTQSEVRGGKFEINDPLLGAISMFQGHKMDNFFVDDRRSPSYNY